MGTALKGVEVFKAGKHKGKPYTVADLDDMVRNFERFQAPGANRLQRAPVVVGHTEKEIHNSAVMKRGEHTRLWRNGEVLLADIDNVDDGLAEAIKAGNYDDVSAEIYNEPPDEFRQRGAKGKVFRRLAVIGGDIPHVKGLNSATGLRGKLETYSERHPTVSVTRATRHSRDSAYTIFSEDVPMTREEMLSKLTASGGNVELLNTFSEEQLAEAVRLHDSAATKAATTTVNIAEFSEDQIGSLVNAVADRVAGPLKKSIDEQLDSSRKALKNQRVDMFCESQLAAGRIDPADMDADNGLTLADRLKALDDSAKVHTFTEGNEKRELTQLEAEMRAISQRTPRYNRNGTKIASGSSGPATFSEDGKKAAKSRFEQHIETFTESLDKMGLTKQEMVQAWESASVTDRREIEASVGFQG